MNPFKIDRFSDGGGEENVISFITGDFIDGSTEINKADLKEKLPILPLRNTIVFPGSTLPISVEEKNRWPLSSRSAKGRDILASCAKKIQR